jgi:pyruvate,water dikinase
MEILLKGLGASSGKIKGKVKIILNPKEIDKLEKGDILVAQATNPLFTIAMSHASAIITDYGGLLSHAAIVARELGVPCVVGTENATKILKDGMEVIVDGKEGIILG